MDAENRLSPGRTPPLKSGPALPGGEIDEAELGIERRRVPHRGSAVAPHLVVRRPRVVAWLTGTRDRVERPDELAVPRVVRLHASAHAELGAGEARDHEAVVVQRRRRDRESVLPALGLHAPDDLACLLIEGDELAVELAREHLAVADRDAAIGPAAASRRDRGVEVRLVRPEKLAAVDVDREHVVRARRNVERAAEEDRLRFAGILRAESRAVQVNSPDTLQTLHRIAIDLGQRRVAAIEPVAAIRGPVTSW